MTKNTSTNCWPESRSSVPVPVKNVIAVFSVATMVALVTFALLPEDQFGVSSLIFGVVGYPATDSSDAPSPASHPIAVFPPAYPNLTADFTAESSSSITDAMPSAASPGPSPAASERLPMEKFLMPVLSPGVGAGNQLMEYISAAVIARATNRTLCLTPFFTGPGKHSGLSVRAATGGLNLEERYDVASLARFTQVASLEQCLEQCNYTLSRNVMLRGIRVELLIRDWKAFQFKNESWNLEWEHAKWQSTKDVNATLAALEDRCVGVGGIFPGLRWRGAFLAVSAFLQPAWIIFESANILQTYAIGKDTPYLAVHWRFEESRCPQHQIGLCFSRCNDGSVIDTNLHPTAKEWLKASENECNTDGHFRGVGLREEDIVATIEERAAKHRLNTVYMATDGWIRGDQGRALVKMVVLMLRKRGLRVNGLWSIPGLPNFADGTYYDPYVTMGKQHVINGQQIALVEQEICVRSEVFLGSGQSTWSLAVFRQRLAKRRSAEILANTPDAVQMDGKAQDKLISETLLKDNHAAGLQCQYSRWMKLATVNDTVETYADELVSRRMAGPGRVRRPHRSWRPLPSRQMLLTGNRTLAENYVMNSRHRASHAEFIPHRASLLRPGMSTCCTNSGTIYA